MNRKLVSLLGVSLLVAACGGGDGEVLFGDPPSASFPIDAGNGVAAVRVSWQSASGSAAFASVGSGAGLSGSAPGAQTIAAQVPGPDGLVLDAISLVPFGPDTFDCEGGSGTITLSGDIADPTTLSRDDTIRIVYDMCDDGAGTVVDGAVDMTIVDFTGDAFLGTFQLVADTFIDNLSISTATESVSGNGDATVTIDTTDTPFVSTGVFGASLTQVTSSSTESLTNYSSDQTFDGNQVPAVYTSQAAGTIDSTQLPGAVVYSTPVTFTGFEGSYPHTGTFKVAGDNSTAWLIAVDADNVRIEIDSNGDGDVDDTIELTWEELLTG